jgi:transcriptional regulator with XRE-family HTH domain
VFSCYFGGMGMVYSNIKRLRELKAITREAIAADLGMGVSGYSKLERGEVDITLSKVYKIAEILGVSLEQLLNFDATQIFNISNNAQVRELGAQSDTMKLYGDDYKEKYIKMLEAEVERLKMQLNGK